MADIEALYLVRSSDSGGFVHISEKDTFDESDAMDAKFVVAVSQPNTLQCLLDNKTKLTIRAIDKKEEMSLDIILLLPSVNDGMLDSLLCTVQTPYGYCWFKLKNFNNYVGQKLKDMKIFDLEPLSDTLLEELCLKHQFFFVGS